MTTISTQPSTGQPAAPPSPNPMPPSTTLRSTSKWTDRLGSLLSFTQGLFPLLVAAIVLWWFGSILKQMLGLAGTEVTDSVWARYTNLYGGLEALAYAAAGFLFGREVNRQRADRAEQDATKSQQIAFDSQSTAAASTANGQALAAGVRALGDAAMHPESGGAKNKPDARREFMMLSRMADTLFPSRQPN